MSYKSVTEILKFEFKNKDKVKWLIPLFKIFNKIKHLEIEANYDGKLNFTEKAKGLLYLQLMKIRNISLLNLFSGLKSLKHIQAENWEDNLNFNEILDPAKIIELDIGLLSNAEFLCPFKKLKSLKVKYFG